MESLNFSISSVEFNSIFPFHLIIDTSNVIKSIGESMLKVIPSLKRNSLFEEEWKIIRPLIPTIANDKLLQQLENKLIVIQHKSKSDVIFKGELKFFKNDNVYGFLGSPWLNSTDELLKNNLHIEDFAYHDSMIDLLHVLKNNEIANNELKEILTKVNEQKKILVTDQFLFYKKEKVLLAIAEASDILLSKKNITNSIKESFQLIGKSIDVNRIQLFENKKNDDNISETVLLNEWNIHNDDQPVESINLLPYKTNLAELFENKLVEKTIDALLPNSPLAQLMNKFSTESVLIIPIFKKEELKQFIIFHSEVNKQWSLDEKSILRSFVNSISSAIERNDSEKEVYKIAQFSLENPDPVVRIDIQGKVLLRNEASENITNFEINKKKRNEKTLFRYLSKKLHINNRQIVFEGNSDNYFYQVTAVLSKNNENINIYLSNITKQKEAEKTLLKYNERLILFQNLINNSSDAVQVSYESGQLMYINKVASERLGISMALCQNYNVRDFEKIFNDETKWLDHINELKNIEYLTIEGENLNRYTNTTFPVEVTVKYLKIGNSGFVIANSRDVTERKNNEKQLKRQEEKFRNIIANMKLGLIEVNLNNEIDFCNQGFIEMSGFDLDEIIGKNPSQLFLHSKEEQEVINNKINTRLKGVSDSYEVIVHNKQGEIRWWLISGAPDYNDNGEIIGSIGIHLDITEQKKLEFNLENALRFAKSASLAKEAFLANMSHEIRTPLNGIIGMIRELNKENLNSRQKMYIESASKASKHLLSIINNVLDLSKIEAGELKLDKVHFDIEEVIFDVKKILESQASEKGLSIELEFSENMSKILIGDAVRIRQILINITGNSLKFTEKGKVKIACIAQNQTSTHQKFVLIIEDTGIGMDEIYVNKIFTKFQQEDLSVSRKYGGTGLGMVITKEIIDLMEGTITVQSKKGEGTKVEINLLLPIGDCKYLDKIKKIANFNQLINKKILLVEDNELNRVVAINALSPAKLLVKEAENGKIAIKMLKKETFDLILMDLQMPIMGGFEATQFIRNELKIKTPIIALTANAFKSEINHCMEVGMNAYVTKPFEEIELINAINNQIGNGEQIEMEDTIVEDTTNSKTQSTYYNLNKLIEMSRGNNAFVVKMLTIFVDSTSKVLVEMNQAFEQNNRLNLSKLAHKIKPSIDNLGIDSLHDKIRSLEQIPDNETPNELKILFTEITSILQLTIESIVNNELNENK